MSHPVSLLFVCLGNICRSPTAEGVMRHLLDGSPLAAQVTVDSAGTGAWHVGDLPDRRSRLEAERRGLVLDHRARKVVPEDFERFDMILAMDRSNLADLRAMSPDRASDRIFLLRSFDPDADHDEVPDPYYGGPEGFAHVFDVVESACRGVLAHLRR